MEDLKQLLDALRSVGLSGHDVVLLICCPIGAAIGSMAHVTLLLINPHRLPRTGETRLNAPIDAFGRAGWISLRLFLGATLGLVLALYFLGSLQPTVPTLAKVIALSIFIGFAAPRLWFLQENFLINQVLKRLRAELSATEKSRSNETGRQDSTLG